MHKYNFKRFHSAIGYQKLMNMYLATQEQQNKWNISNIRNWSLTISQLAIHFEGRLDKALNL